MAQIWNITLFVQWFDAEIKASFLVAMGTLVGI